MDYVVICLTALLASGLTLISGFGLGTLLMPAFALFFPVGVAVALTAIVHLTNNLFKLWLVGLRADRRLVLRFGIPACVASLLGALVLSRLAHLPPLAQYVLHGHACRIEPVNLAIALLMGVFAILEALPWCERRDFSERWLPLGGALSGFIGGISGHQGALRSAFLMRFKGLLTKESYIATGVVIACLVDVSRLAVYSGLPSMMVLTDHLGLVSAATISAFTGAYVGSRFMHKVTFRGVQMIVAILLFMIAIALGSGWLS
ncbi:MAG: sulfite exporter TauE/SafE family protein [Planctomycetes bacterium]|nr:sulfite exporter TauE/SafE family protein [Planctomycetota bacterium]